MCLLVLCAVVPNMLRRIIIDNNHSVKNSLTEQCLNCLNITVAVDQQAKYYTLGQLQHGVQPP